MLRSFVFLYCKAAHQDLHSFPTRRSSDLTATSLSSNRSSPASNDRSMIGTCGLGPSCRRSATLPDRKSTRLNSSHANISYAVFCLKKKKKNQKMLHTMHMDKHQKSGSAGM